LENPRPEKVAVVDEVKDRLNTSSAALLTEYRGLSVAQLATLRRQLRDAGGEMKVYKNTLVRFAARDLGLDIEELLTGPTAIAFVDGDPVNVAKALRDFARTNPALVVKGGLLGEKSLSAAETTALADVEPREVLLAKLAGAMAAPMVQFAGLLQALPRNFAYGLKALLEDRTERGANATIDDEAQPADPSPVAEAAPETTDAAAADEAPAAENNDVAGEPATNDAAGEPATNDEAPAEDAAAPAETEES
jgi:large subunit ribosomal protein L10